VAKSDFILLVLDGSRGLDRDDFEIFGELGGKRKIIAINKKDLQPRLQLEDVRKEFSDPIVWISALEKDGIEDLKEAIYNSLTRGEIRLSAESVIVANVRHKIALQQTKDNLSAGLRGLDEETSLEFIAFEIRSALEVLGEIVGETTTEEVLDRIFEQFCIGK